MPAVTKCFAPEVFISSGSSAVGQRFPSSSTTLIVKYARELWKEDIRECKILATLIMPADKISADVVEVWMEGVKTQEVAEMLAFNLLQYVDFAPVLAYGFIASSKPLEQICGFHILSRLFMKGQEPNEKGINEFIDQAQAALKDENLGVRHAAATCVMRFADLGIVYERLAKSAFKGVL